MFPDNRHPGQLYLAKAWTSANSAFSLVVQYIAQPIAQKHFWHLTRENTLFTAFPKPFCTEPVYPNIFQKTYFKPVLSLLYLTIKAEQCGTCCPLLLLAGNELHLQPCFCFFIMKFENCRPNFCRIHLLFSWAINFATKMHKKSEWDELLLLVVLSISTGKVALNPEILRKPDLDSFWMLLLVAFSACGGIRTGKLVLVLTAYFPVLT